MHIELLNNSSISYNANQSNLLKIGIKIATYMAAMGFAILGLIKVYQTDEENSLPSFATLSGFSLISFLASKYLS